MFQAATQLIVLTEVIAVGGTEVPQSYHHWSSEGITNEVSRAVRSL